MRDYADVVIKPPVLFAGTLLLGLFLSWFFPIGPGLGDANWRALAAGGTLALAGLGIGIQAVRQFRAGGTSLVPGEPSTMLLESGPYRFTRNPIYIGFILLYFGIAIMATSVWLLVLLVPVLMVLQRGVVEREEAYLTDKFGEPYRKYQARVPRWV